MKKMILAASALAISAASASAADLAPRTYAKAPPLVVEPAYNWSGFYAGVNAGGVVTQDRNSLSIVNDPTNGFFNPPAIAGVNASGSQSLNHSGFIGGAQIGYNWQAPGSQFVWGVEADFQGITGSKSAGGMFPYTTIGSYLLTESASTNWLLTLRPRVGYATGSTLWYVTGGLAVADRKFGQSFADGGVFAAGSSFVASSSGTSVGWTVGAGVETSVAANLTVKAEYLFAELGSRTSTFNLGDQNNGLATFTNSDKLDMHILRLGLNYHFSGPIVAKY